MVKELVVRGELTDAMVSAGSSLTQCLDERGWPVSASLWFFFPEEGRWKLILASSNVAEKGPREAYAAIRDVISEMPEDETHVGLQDIQVTTPDNALLQLMNRAIGTGPGLSQIRLSQNVINGTLIEDALIYRLNVRAA